MPVKVGELLGVPRVFVDARKVEQGIVVEGAVCIVGAGVAGIAIAIVL